jgi:hypothetical protein
MVMRVITESSKERMADSTQQATTLSEHFRYWRQVAREVWRLSREQVGQYFSDAIGWVLFISSTWYFAGWGEVMEEMLSSIPAAVSLAVIFLGWCAANVYRAVTTIPIRLQRENEALKREVAEHEEQSNRAATRQAQREVIARFIEEGKRMQALFATINDSPPFDEAETWGTTVRDYIHNNFGLPEVVQWENESGLSFPPSQEEKTIEALAERADLSRRIERGAQLPLFSRPISPSEQEKMYRMLSSRLIRLHELLARLQSRERGNYE